MGVLHNWAALGGGPTQGGDKVTLVPLGTCMPQGDRGYPSISHSESPDRAVASRESQPAPPCLLLLILGRNFIFL